MLEKVLLPLVLVVFTLAIVGCNTAKGLKEDVTFIGDKTVEFIEKDD